MQRLVSYQLFAITPDGREVTHPGPARVEVYTAQEVDDLLHAIRARLSGHSFALGSDIRALITRGLKAERA